MCIYREISIWAGAGVGFAFEMAYLLALLLGASQLMAGTITYGTLTAILQLVGQVQQPFLWTKEILYRLQVCPGVGERSFGLSEGQIQRAAIRFCNRHLVIDDGRVK